MKKTFEMNGKAYDSMTAIAKELGVKRIYPKDFAKYGITESSKDKSADTATDNSTDCNNLTLEQLSEKLKGLSLEKLEGVAKGLSLEKVTVTNDNIKRMQLTMAIKRAVFPTIFPKVGAKRNASSWKDVSLDKMIKVAKKNKITYKDYQNDRITRMHLVMAFNKSGLTAEKCGVI
jgi:hypothetical protein